MVETLLRWFSLLVNSVPYKIGSRVIFAGVIGTVVFFLAGLLKTLQGSIVSIVTAKCT